MSVTYEVSEGCAVRIGLFVNGRRVSPDVRITPEESGRIIVARDVSKTAMASEHGNARLSTRVKYFKVPLGSMFMGFGMGLNRKAFEVKGFRQKNKDRAPV